MISTLKEKFATFSMKATDSKDLGKVNQILPIMQEYFGNSMNLGDTDLTLEKVDVLHRILTKIFHAEIVVDSAKVAAEMKEYKKIPVIAEFKDNDGNDILQAAIDGNYRRVKQEIIALVEAETQRIKADPELSRLINKRQ